MAQTSTTIPIHAKHPTPHHPRRSPLAGDALAFRSTDSNYRSHRKSRASRASALLRANATSGLCLGTGRPRPTPAESAQHRTTTPGIGRTRSTRTLRRSPLAGDALALRSTDSNYRSHRKSSASRASALLRATATSGLCLGTGRPRPTPAESAQHQTTTPGIGRTRSTRTLRRSPLAGDALALRSTDSNYRSHRESRASRASALLRATATSGRRVGSG
jgi:hypothetical protein